MATPVRASLRRGALVFGVATVGFGYYQRKPRDYGDHLADSSQCVKSRLYRALVVPVVMNIDPETAHLLTLRLGRALQSVRLLSEPLWTGATPLDWLLRPHASKSEPSGPGLEQDLLGGRLHFDTPFGLAAGFDKNAELVPLYRLGAIPGLGFSEVGSVSALPSEGNPKPRCFRLPRDEAVINRMGLNNEGSEGIAEKLKGYEVLGTASSPAVGAPSRAPLGVNITKTHSPSIMGDEAVEDFATSYRRLAPHADFVVLNISCPNTAEGKTFEDPDTLSSLLRRVKDIRCEMASTVPVFVKLAPPPDTEAGKQTLRSLVDVVQSSGTVDGFVVSNTAGDRNVPLSKQGKKEAEAIGRGGISGRPLRNRSTIAIREVYRLTGGKVPIIGVGGVDSPEGAYEKIRAGASLIEVYSGLVYKGPFLFSDLHLGLRRLLERDGFSSVSQAVGADVD